MPKIDVYDINGKKVKELELNEAVFGIEPNEAVVHSVLVNFLANQRQGTQSTKTRSEVSGGGRKPWRQKGTGRARQGSIRAPQWIKGGIALGPKPRSYKYTVNKKERQLAVKSVLSSKVLENELVVVDSLPLNDIKTKEIGGTPVAKAAYWTVTDVEARKRGEQTGLDTLVVHAVNDEY